MFYADYPLKIWLFFRVFSMSSLAQLARVPWMDPSKGHGADEGLATLSVGRDVDCNGLGMCSSWSAG